MPDDLFYLIKGFSIAFGLLVGSFLNVVIHRIPLNLSVITPRSSCPKCSHKIKWYENIPVISYIFLRGRCSGCSTQISIKYPLIELTVGIFAGLLSPKFLEPSHILMSLFHFSILCIFLAHFLIDIKHQILPDKINLYFLAITLPFAIMNFPPMYWILGGAIGFLGPYLVTYAFYKLRGQIGLGGGDIKLFGILGLLLGPIGILNTVFLSCTLGAVVGIFMILIKKMNKNTPLAFGPFILIVATVQIFFPKFIKLISLIQ